MGTVLAAQTIAEYAQKLEFNDNHSECEIITESIRNMVEYLRKAFS